MKKNKVKIFSASEKTGIVLEMMLLAAELRGI